MKTQKLDSKIFQLIKNIRIAVLVMGAAIFFYACTDDIVKIKAFSTSENLPTQEAINFETLTTDSGVIRNSMKAPLLLQFQDPDGQTYIEFPKGIEILKYDAEKNIISSLKADYAKQVLKENKWEAKNNVVVTNAKGDSLKTEHLIWEEKNKKIYTEEFVQIIRDNQTITGMGMTSDQDMQEWQLKNPKGSIFVGIDKKEKVEQPSNNIAKPTDKQKPERKKTLQFK